MIFKNNDQIINVITLIYEKLADCDRNIWGPIQ